MVDGVTKEAASHRGETPEVESRFEYDAFVDDELENRRFRIRKKISTRKAKDTRTVNTIKNNIKKAIDKGQDTLCTTERVI